MPRDPTGCIKLSDSRKELLFPGIFCAMLFLYGNNWSDFMLAQLKSATLLGLSVSLVEIEVDAAAGLPAWEMVGYRVHT